MATKTVEQQDQQRSSSQPSGSQGRALTTGALFPMSPFALLNPFAMMRRMIEVVDPESGQGAPMERTWMPAVEVCKTNGTYLVRAELPGVTPDHVKVEVAGDALVLEGDREFEHEEKEGGIYRTERQYGHFFRSIPLPEGANVDQMKAKFENGLLEISVPVANPQQARQIPIESSSASTSRGKA